MTKKEQKNIITKHVIEMISKNFEVSTDFYDDDGHGYFTFGVMKDGVEYLFDMGRNDFSIISHKVMGEKGHFESINLESELETFIKNEIVIVKVKEGII